MDEEDRITIELLRRPKTIEDKFEEANKLISDIDWFEKNIRKPLGEILEFPASFPVELQERIDKFLKENHD